MVIGRSKMVDGGLIISIAMTPMAMKPTTYRIGFLHIRRVLRRELSGLLSPALSSEESSTCILSIGLLLINNNDRIIPTPVRVTSMIRGIRDTEPPRITIV